MKDRDEEISNIKKSLEDYIIKNVPGFEVHLFESEKQEKRKKILDMKLPLHDQCQLIKKSDAWIVWICDENQYITDLQVYDFQQEHAPYKRQKIVEYLDYWSNTQDPKIPYRDCGCVNSNWDQWNLQDIYFNFGMRWGFLNRNVMVKSLKRLACIDKFRNNILKHLTSIE